MKTVIFLFFIFFNSTFAIDKIEYYSNGNIKAIIPTNGEAKYFYKVDNFIINLFSNKGKLQAIVSVKNYKENGLKTAYYKNGSIRAKIFYRNGQLHGKNTHYYKNGNLKYETTFYNGNVGTVQKNYYENGNLKSIYNGNTLKAKKEIYYKNGNLKSEIIFDKGSAISGYNYTIEGTKTKLTKAHLYEINQNY